MTAHSKRISIIPIGDAIELGESHEKPWIISFKKENIGLQSEKL